MRLLNTSTYELSEDAPAPSAGYAILSHRWDGPEITFQTLSPADLRNRNKDTPQLNKIRGACAKAKQQDHQWLWDDTCCINKTNAVEEAKSINSMFEWYSDATVCYAYLSDVDSSQRQMFKSQKAGRKADGLESEWFERGWTLQELLAPQRMEFYDFKWRFMGTKVDLADDLQRVTGINKNYLLDSSLIHTASVAARMSWMAGRMTGYVEDIAYSMLGIFGITMTLQYGEGKQAFMRLQKTLMETSPDESIFAWTVPETKQLACFGKPNNRDGPKFAHRTWGLLAPSPDCFKKSGAVVVKPDKVVPRLNGGYSWTQQGVQFQMSFKSGTEATNMFGVPRKEIDLPLNCWKNDATVMLRLVKTKNGNGYERDRCDDPLTLKKGAKPSTNSVFGIDQVLTRPLTITQPTFN